MKLPRRARMIKALRDRRATGGVSRPNAPTPTKVATGASLPPVQISTPKGGFPVMDKNMTGGIHQGKAPRP